MGRQCIDPLISVFPVAKIGAHFLADSVGSILKSRHFGRYASRHLLISAFFDWIISDGYYFTRLKGRLSRCRNSDVRIFPQARVATLAGCWGSACAGRNLQP